MSDLPRINPTLIPAYDEIDELMLAADPEVVRDDGQAKGRMYKVGSARLCGVRVRTHHLSLHLYGLAHDEPDTTGLLVSRTGSHLRAQISTYEEACRVGPLLQRTYVRGRPTSGPFGPSLT